MYLPVLWTLFVCVSRLIFFSIYCSVYRFFLLFINILCLFFFFFFQAEDGIRDKLVTGVQTCALPIFAKVKAGGGVMEMSDLGEFESEWVEPITTNYHGYDVHQLPPPGQGFATLQRSEERRVGKECRSRWSP